MTLDDEGRLTDEVLLGDKVIQTLLIPHLVNVRVTEVYSIYCKRPGKCVLYNLMFKISDSRDFGL